MKTLLRSLLLALTLTTLTLATAQLSAQSLVPVIDSTNACPSLNNGEIEVVTATGTAGYTPVLPLTYSWSDIGAGPGTRTGLAAGTYTVTVTDDNGVTGVETIELETVDFFDSGTTTNPEGCELNGGQINVVVTADNTPLKYSLDGGTTFQTSSTFTNVPPNTYVVTVQDAQGCEIGIAGVNVAGGTSPISIGTPTVTDVECFGEATGEISMTAVGGTAPYTYTLTGPSGTISNTTGSFTGFLAGAYDIEVIGDAGCRFTSSETIGTNTELTYDVAVTDATCGNTDGEITISNEAGGQPFAGGSTVIYSENFNGAGPFDVVMNDVTTAPVGPVIPSALASDPSNGTQSLFVINSNYVHPLYGVLPDQPAGITGGPGKTGYMHVAAPAAYPGPFYNSSIPGVPFSLWSRTIAIDATGLTGVEVNFWWANQNPTANVYLYNGTGWILQNGTGNLNSGNAANPNELEKVTASPPPAGSAEWFEASLINPSLTDNQIFYIGFGQDFSPGTASNPVFQIDDIEVTATSAGTDYEYTFDGGATWGTTASTSGLAPGTYTVGIRDALGCESLQTVTVGGTGSTVSIDNVVPTDATCTGSDGTIAVTASGGTPPLEYSVDGGATYQTGSSFNNLAAGSYDVYVRDAGGCTDNPAFQTTTVGTNTVTLTYTETATGVTCYGDSDGEITLTPTNGTSAYTFSIDNGTTTQATGTFSSLDAGNYSVMITDANGCTGSSTVAVPEPAPIDFVGASTDEICSNGAGEIEFFNVTGGDGSYTYSINGGASPQAGATFTGLSAGSFNLVVTDGNGCTSSSTATIDNSNPTLTFTATPTDETCTTNDGSIVVSGESGGAAPYEYRINAGAYQASATFSGLTAGTYSVQVRDDNGCESTATDFIVGNGCCAPGSFTISLTPTDPTCNGLSDGEIEVDAVTGGTAPYEYSTDGTNFQTATTLAGLSAGPYTITVRDDAGCTNTETTTLTDPAAITYTASITPETCLGNDGAITLTPAGGAVGGGTPGTLYFEDFTGGATQATPNWVDASFTGSVSGATFLAPGNELGWLVNQDVNGFTAGNEYSSSATPAGSGGNRACLGITVGVFGVGSVSGSFFANVTNGSDVSVIKTNSISTAGNTDVGINFHTINGSTGAGRLYYRTSGTAPNWVEVGVYDNQTPNWAQENVSAAALSNALDNQASVEIAFALQYDNVTTGANPSFCVDDIEVVGTSSGGSYEFSDDGGTTWGTSGTFTGLGGGDNDFVIRDGNLCELPLTETIPSQDGPSMDVDTVNVTCSGDADGELDVTTTGGNPPYTYTVNGNPETFPLAVLSGGSYTIEVTDDIGCTETAVAQVIEPAGLTLNTLAIQTPSCVGATDAEVELQASGGTPPLQFSLDNGTNLQAGVTFTGLDNITYNPFVIDDNGCTATASAFTIADPTPVVITTVTNSPETCAGGDGEITITATGPGTLEYSIDGGANYSSGAAFTGLTAGNYDIVVRNTLLCEATQNNYNLPGATTPTIDVVDKQDISCFGLTDGEIAITASGGTGAFEYSIDGGANFQASNTFTGLAAGLLNIIVRDASSCEATTTETILEPTELSVTVVPTNQSCTGTPGQLDFNATGGSTPYEYSIDAGANFQSSDVFTGLAPAAYNWEVRDDSGCVVTGSETIGVDAAVTLDVDSVDVSCNGAADGQVIVTATGGTPPLSYAINGGTPQASNTFTGLSGGSFNVVVSDASGCPDASSTITVNEAPALVLDSTITDITCNSDDDGEIELSATGGEAPYQFSVNGGALTATTVYSNLTPGLYTLLVQDDAGCQTTGLATIDEPTAITADADSVNESCAGNDGEVSITASGGTGTLEYSFDGGAFGATSTFTGQTAGTYPWSVRDANSCTLTGSIEVFADPVLSLDDIDSVDVSCNGAGDGQVIVTATGGTPPLSYAINGGTPQASNTFTGLSGGTFNIVVSGSGTCPDETGSIVVNEAPALVLDSTITDITCNSDDDGEIELSATGGEAPYQFSINGGALTATTVYSNLTPGLYTLLVQDDAGCQTTGLATIDEPTAITADADSVNESCAGNDGEVSITASGGTGTLEYSFDGGAFGATSTFTGQTAGTYPWSVRDANSCTLTGSIEVFADPVLSLDDIDSVDVSCNGAADGQVIVTATGGTPPLSYAINGGTPQASNTFTGLSGGSFNVVVSDASGCPDASSTITVNEAPALVLDSTVTDITCNSDDDGEIELSATGGEAPYQFSINGGALTATTVYSNLTPGLYTLLVQDDAGCQTTGLATIDEPTAITADADSVNESCAGNDGEVSITASGGTGTLEYSFDGGAFGATSTFTGQTAGTYPWSVRDANSCTLTGSIEVFADPAFIVDADSVDVSCNGASDGEISLTAAGGTAPYSYSIDNGGSFQVGATFTGLSGGTYDIVVQDASGCPNATTSIVVNEATALVLDSVVTDISCNGQVDGEIQLNATGGVGPYLFSINGGATQQAIGGFTGLSAGLYQLQVVDAAGCTTDGLATIDEPAVLTLTTDSTDATCQGLADGQITLTATGGTSPYNYSIDGGATTNTTGVFAGLPAAAYPNVQVTDASGCTVTATSAVINDDTLALAVDTLDVNCPGNGDGQLILTGQGGTAPYTYSIDNGTTFQLSDTFTGLGPGVYNLAAQDDNGCLVNATAAVNEGPALVASVSTEPTNCNGSADGVIRISTQNGTAPYSFSADGGTTSQPDSVFNALVANPYAVLVTDDNGCTYSEVVDITQPDVLSLSASVLKPFCNLADNGEITLTATGGNGGYQYSLDGGALQASNVFGSLTTGAYTMAVEDDSACTTTVTVNVLPSDTLVLETNISGVTCNGNADGSVILTGANGLAPFEYSEDGIAYNSTNSFSNLTPGNYTYFVRDGYGCESQANVFIGEPANLQLLAFVTDVSCSGFSTDGAVDLAAIGGTDPIQYSSNGVNYTPVGSYSGLTPGIYQYFVQDANGCTDTLTAKINEKAQIDIVGVVTDAQGGANAGNGEIQVAIFGGQNPYDIVWSNGATNTTNLIGLNSGQYIVEVTDGNGCSGIDSFFVDFTSGRGTEELAQAIQMYPNPTAGQVTVTGEFSTQRPAEMTLFDVTGKLVYRQLFKAPENALQFDLAAGVYTVRIIQGNAVYSQKLVITR